MNKRIFRNMGLLALFIVLAASLMLALFSGQLGTQIKDGLKTMRVTMINPAGEVLFDNQANADEMENHLNRPEMQAALQNGFGESERYSDTLQQTTYYYAVRLGGGNILRLAMTTDSVQAILGRFLPLAGLCLLFAAILAFWVAKRLTKRIIEPINGIDLDAPEIGDYEELLPFVKRIETQKKELADRYADLENREDTIQMITSSMHEGLLLLDGGGVVRMANESASSILDAPATVGQNIVQFCRDTEFLNKVKTCRAGNRAEMTFRKGEQIYNVFFNPMEEAGQSSAVIILFVDITERYAAETHRKEFSANVSHELKTPLTTISALSEMIANGTAKQPDIQQFGEKINTQSQRLISIIDDIIKLSEFDEGEMSKAFSRFDLFGLTESAADSLREKAERQNISIEIAGTAPLPIVANRRMIDELLFNLIDNAITYNRPGGTVTVELGEDTAYYRISVRDTGIGIEQKHLRRVFERFYRVDKSRSKRTGGTGLGLSIVKHIVEFHGGTVEIASEQGAGTCVTCVIKKR